MGESRKVDSELEGAVEIFVSAILKIKNLYHPHVCDRFGPLHIMSDPPGRKNPRKTEVVVLGQTPESVVAATREAGLDWHYLCDIQGDESSFKETRERYKSLGYRALATEWMFAHDLIAIPNFKSDPAPKRVESQAKADKIRQIATRKIKLAPDSRDFVIWDDIRDYGRVRSIDIGNSCWVQGLYVQADVRRQGYGKALMSTLLESDRALGRERSLLMASAAGAAVYPLLGYRKIGVLQLFSPIRDSP